MKVKLSDLINTIKSSGYECTNYYHYETGTILCRFEDFADERIENEFDMHGNQYIRIPSRFDIDEYSLMEEFIDGISETKQKDILMNAIHSKRAFQNFKECLKEFGLHDYWNEYLEKAYLNLAKKWCEDHYIDYEEGNENEDRIR